MWNWLTAAGSSSGAWVLADTSEAAAPWLNAGLLVQHLVAALVFSLLGVVVFGAAITVLSRMLPFSLRKEIEEDQNVALAIIIASVFLGMALIIAAAMIG